MALAESIARIGCFLAGCCHGIPWNGPLAVVFPAGSAAFSDQLAAGQLPLGATHSLPVHPVQLYSTAAMAAVFVALWHLHARNRHPDGALFFAFLASYGALRVCLLPLRADALPLQAAFGAAFLVAGVAGLLFFFAPTSSRQLRAAPSPTTER
jgi:phosphatidylglycerol:prolipoprotein diacylglycerol transferase